MQQMAQYSKQLEAQNGYKSSYIDNITKEFVQKIGVANKVIAQQSKMIDQANQASEGETKSNNARGVGGTHIQPVDNA